MPGHPSLHRALGELGIDPAVGPRDRERWEALLRWVGHALEQASCGAKAASADAGPSLTVASDETRAFAHLATENPSPVFVVSSAGFLLYANRVAQPLLSEWCLDLGERAPAALGDLVREATQTARPVNTELRIGTRTFGMLAAPSPGKEYVCIHGRDITEIKRIEAERIQAETALRKSEEQLRVALESAQMGTWRWDPSAGVSWDESVERLFSFLPESSTATPTGLLGFVHAEDREAIVQALTAAARGQRAFHAEGRITKPDGRVSWVNVRGRGFLDAGGDTAGMIGVIQDVTERKALEGQLVHAQKLESIGQLAAGIAHEINTPTQYIGDNTRFVQEAFNDISVFLGAYREVLRSAHSGSIHAELIERCEAAAERADLDYLSEEIPKAIQQSLDGVARVAKIVSAMKEFSHPGNEEKTPLDLNRAIESTITVARNEWKYVAEMETDLDPNLPPVPGLPGELNQVVLNILVNAAHAIADHAGSDPSAKGRIRVSTRCDADWVELRIADTGSGIPEAIRPKIFDPFFTTKPVGRGTGQGLGIARSIIVHKHGGTIDFETEVGRGTTFVIRLPLHAAAEPPAAEPAGAEAA
jgi:PAS domain S-box-containing protein